MECFCYKKAFSQERKPKVKKKTFWEYFVIIYIDTKHSDYMQACTYLYYAGSWHCYSQ